MQDQQLSYSAGELDPSLHAHADLARWRVGLAKAENVVVQVEGGCKKRTGTVHAGDDRSSVPTTMLWKKSFDGTENAAYLDEPDQPLDREHPLIIDFTTAPILKAVSESNDSFLTRPIASVEGRVYKNSTHDYWVNIQVGLRNNDFSDTPAPEDVRLQITTRIYLLERSTNSFASSITFDHPEAFVMPLSVRDDADPTYFIASGRVSVAFDRGTRSVVAVLDTGLVHEVATYSVPVYGCDQNPPTDPSTITLDHLSMVSYGGHKTKTPNAPAAPYKVSLFKGTINAFRFGSTGGLVSTRVSVRNAPLRFPATRFYSFDIPHSEHYETTTQLWEATEGTNLMKETLGLPTSDVPPDAFSAHPSIVYMELHMLEKGVPAATKANLLLQATKGFDGRYRIMSWSEGASGLVTSTTTQAFGSSATMRELVVFAYDGLVRALLLDVSDGVLHPEITESMRASAPIIPISSLTDPANLQCISLVYASLGGIQKKNSSSGGDDNPSTAGHRTFFRYAIPNTFGDIGSAYAPARLYEEKPEHRLIPFSLSRSRGFMLHLSSEGVINFLYKGLYLQHTEGMRVTVSTYTDADGQEQPIPYAAEDLPKIRYAQRNTELYLSCKGIPLLKIEYYDDNGEPRFRAKEATFHTEAVAPDAVVATRVGADNPTNTIEAHYAATTVFNDGRESFATESNQVTIPTMSNWNAKYTVSVEVAFDETAAPRGLKAKDVSHFIIYKKTRGYYGYIGYVPADWSGTEYKVTFIDDNVNPTSSDGVRKPRFPFEDNPSSAICVHQQRMFYGGTKDNQQRLLASRTGDLEDMSVSTPLKNTDALDLTLDTVEGVDIRHIVSLDKLMVLTDAGIWAVSSGSRNSGAITPSSRAADFQSALSVSDITPVKVDVSVLLTPSDLKGVFELGYNYDVNGYDTKALHLTAAHLFRNTKIVCSAWQPSDRVLWVVLADGRLVSLTYLKEQKVVAWARHDVSGFVKAMGVVRGEYYDVPYMLVERWDLLSAEYISYRHPTAEWRDTLFLDCAYAGSFLNSVYVPWFAGVTVKVLVNGELLPSEVTVPEHGYLDLPNQQGRIVVGLPYTARIQTLGLSGAERSGAEVLNQPKNPHEVILTVDETRELSVGADSLEGSHYDLLDPNLTLHNQSEIDGLFSGKILVNVASGWDRYGKVWVESKEPYPFTLLAHELDYFN